jgi:hypothetical protein
VDEVLELRLLAPERGVEETLVDGDPARSGRLDDPVVFFWRSLSLEWRYA